MGGTFRQSRCLSGDDSLFIFARKFPKVPAMTFKTLLPFILAGTLLTGAGARAATPVVITHVADVKKTIAAIRFTEEIRIMLPAPADAPAGHEWQIISNDSRILRLTSSPRPATAAGNAAVTDKSTAPAPSSVWATTFLALRPGRSVVRLAFVRADNKGVETPLETREINVNVR